MSVDLATVDELALDILPAGYVSAAITSLTALTKGASPGPVAVLLDVDNYAGGVVTARWADRGLQFQVSGSTALIGYDLPGETFTAIHLADAHVAYQQRLMDRIEIHQSVLDAADIGGRAALTVGEFTLRNDDRALDSMAQLGEALGRSVTIKTVAAISPYASNVGSLLSSAATVFKGVVSGFGAAGQTVTLAVSDLSEKLAQPLQPNLYDGTGGTGGSGDLKGRPKPVALGFLFNITPVYLGLVDFGDGALPTYQSNWRAVLAHDAVRERGAAITATSSAPTTGLYRDWPAYGCFQIGFTADGAITCDVRGDAVPSYAGSTAGIVERILTGSLGPGLASSDLDSDSFARTAIALSGEIGWYSGTESVTGQAALDAVLDGAGAVLSGGRAGTLRLAAIAVPTSTTMFDLDAYDCVSVKPVPLPASLAPTPSLVEVAAQKNWTVLSDIAGAVTGDDRDAIAGAGRTASSALAAVSLRQSVARTMSLAGLYRYETDALTRAVQIAAWLSGGLKAFEVETDRYLNQIEIGHYGRITYGRYGLDAGFFGVVFAWRADPIKRRVTFTIIG